MEKLTLNLPTMYGDHHVIEVRRILLEMPGIENVYASSAFQVVEVTYDPKKLDAQKIKGNLDAAGYVENLPLPTETGAAAYGQGHGSKNTFFRHTAAYEQTKKVVGFAQNVSYAGQPLWPCPGMGVLKRMEVEE